MKKSWLDKLLVAVTLVANLALNLIQMGFMLVVVLGGHVVHKLRKK